MTLAIDTRSIVDEVRTQPIDPISLLQPRRKITGISA